MNILLKHSANNVGHLRVFSKCLKEELVSGLNRREKSLKIRNLVLKSEKLVGHSTCFLNLKWLLNEEVVTLSSKSLGKLVGTKHPLINTAKTLLVRQEEPTWALLVLLISKAEGLNGDFNEIEVEEGILHTQRMVAEISELIKSGISFHKSLVIVKEQDGDLKEMQQGNKMALLIGDYLITKSYEALAAVNNDQVELIISSALRDICEAEFLDDRFTGIPQFIPEDIAPGDEFTVEPINIKNFMGNPLSEWTLRHFLGGASLLGKSCLSALKLGGHSEYLQNQAYKFGRNIALAFQANNEINKLLDDVDDPTLLVSAPVMFHLDYDASFYKHNKVVDFRSLRDAVKKGPGIEKAIILRNHHKRKAIEAMTCFNDSASTKTLRDLVNAL